jgi:hypothetical protein
MSATVTVDDKGYVTDIEGDYSEEEPRALAVVKEPDRLTLTHTPEDMVGLASRMATILADVVEKRKLYATIRGKKYPQVEAWMTIGRMDGVVAREHEPPVRHEDGSYEAVVDLIRLADGMVIGSGSAICGESDDEPWAKRQGYAKRSMAVTRATSRAFRQQYAWIMALAGYEATPADEMPTGEPKGDAKPSGVGGETEELIGIETRDGTVRVGGGATTKLEVRQTTGGLAFGFALETAKGNLPQVIIEGDLAAAILVAEQNDPRRLKDHWCRVKGRVFSVRQPERRGYFRMRVTEFETENYRLPAKAEPIADLQTDFEQEMDAVADSLGMVEKTDPLPDSLTTR